MSKKTLEHLSSLMDGELSQETGLFLTRRVCADEELGQTWERYHLIRDCLRSSGEHGSVARVSMQIDALLPGELHAEPEVATGASKAAPTWLKPLSGLAVAASVALAAILVVLPQSDPTNPEAVAQPFSSPNTLNTGPAVSQPASFNGGNQRLNNYLIRHNQVAGSVGRQGSLALIPIVSGAESDDSDLETVVEGQENTGSGADTSSTEAKH
jgi:sigma-E factor negative regulatory protein RseA